MVSDDEEVRRDLHTSMDGCHSMNDYGRMRRKSLTTARPGTDVGHPLQEADVVGDRATGVLGGRQGVSQRSGFFPNYG